MTTRHEKLMYVVSLLDKVSAPAGKVGRAVDKMSSRWKSGIGDVAGGAAGLFSVGYALKSILSPAVEMDRALGEVRSLGVTESGLKLLEKTALRFSVKYGESATAIVASAYDIQSAIGGLTDFELSRFTEQSALLAKATKSNSGTITDYMGTMYGVFKTQADAMGRSNWVDQLTNMTAAGVERFKTTGDKMAQAFSRLGSLASTRGISMAEQMAVMGTLQATMGGGESATKYTAFLSKVGNAQDQLGLKFTDSAGRMLPVVDILKKIKGRFGELDKTADLDLLAKAFGGKEGAAFVAALAKDIPGLENSIKSLQDAAGSNKAADMAAAIADPWQRLNAVVTAVSITFGRLLQPVLNPMVDSITAHLGQLRELMDKYPNITRLVGKLVLGVFALVAVLSTLSIAMGIGKFLMVGWGAASLVLSGGLTALTSIITAARVAVLWFNGALLLNPITWIVLGIVSLIAILAVLILRFDDVKAAWRKYVIDPLKNDIAEGGIFGKFTADFERIKTGWMLIYDLVKKSSIGAAMAESLTNLFKPITEFIDKIISGWAMLWDMVQKLDVRKKIDSQLDRWAGALGLRGDSASATTAPGVVAATPLIADRVPQGGMMQEIRNTTDNRRGTTIENLTVNTTQPVNPWTLENALTMAGG